ncbi:MAG: peptidoglycan recognition family protein [Myxococcota bacterium]
MHHSSFVEPPGPLGLKQYHQQIYRWADLGYHFVIDTEGKIYEGRNIRYMGAHAGTTLEANRAVVAIRRGATGRIADARKLDPDWGAIGIVVDGYFDSGIEPSAAQTEALTWLIGLLQEKYGARDEQVITHQEVKTRIVEAAQRTLGGGETTCPGSGLQAVVDAMRRPPR